MYIRLNNDSILHTKAMSLILFFVIMLVYIAIHVNGDKKNAYNKENESKKLCVENNVCDYEKFIYNVNEHFDERIQQRVISMYVSDYSDVKPSVYSKPNAYLDINLSYDEANKIMYRINQAKAIQQTIPIVASYNSNKYILLGLKEDLSKIIVPEKAKLKK